MTAIWQPLRDELREWRARDRTPRFWLRDDDAVEPSTDLDSLIAATAAHQVPLVLAIVPASTGSALARRLEQSPHVFPAVHGWSHANHAPAGEKKQELGPHRDLSIVREDCARGLSRLRELYGGRLLPMLVPPWNRFTPVLAAHLPALGFAALSAFGHGGFPIVSGLTIVNAHVDLVDWRGDRRCQEPPVLIDRLVAELQLARQMGDDRRGVLSHHLIGDPRQFAFLRELFEETPGLWRLPLAA